MNAEKIAVGVVLTLIIVLIGVAIFRSEDTLAAPETPKNVAPSTVGTPPPFPANPMQPVIVNYDEISRGAYRTRQPPMPREAESRPAPLPVTRAYVVRSGDTFGRIAKRELGSTALAGKIATLNPTVNERGLRVGTKLMLPEAQRKSKSTTTAKKPTTKKSTVSAGTRL